MLRSRILIILGLWVSVVGGLTSPLVAQTLTIDIPNKSFNVHPPFQIATVKLTFSFASVPNVKITGVDLNVTSSDLLLQPWTPPRLTATGNFDCSINPNFCHDFTPAGVGADQARLSHPDPAGYDSDHYQRYELDIDLKSNYTLSSCDGTQSGLIGSFDHYTIVATPVTATVDPMQPAPAPIVSACLESYDHDGMANCLGPPTHFVTNSPADLKINTVLQPRACFKHRPGVDVFLVLDKSGSMASSTLGGDPEPKIEALQEAVRDFVTAWDDARSMEATLTPPVNNPDNIGVALFDQFASPWTDGTLTAGLNVFAGADSKILSNLNPMTCTATSCGQLVPGTSTSIGAGLLSADAGFQADGNRHVILLMSDGMQNTNPMVRPFDPSDPTNPAPTSPTAIATYSLGTPNIANQLPHETSSNYQLYAVTVGTGIAVSAAINQDIAHATGGFYINTEDNADQLKAFFLELLQNVLRFNSYDTIRMISKIVPPATLPFSTCTPVSTTSHDVEFSLMWPRTRGALRFTVTPPGGAQPIVKESASGFISIVQQLPLPVPFDPTGNWNILVEGAHVRDGAAGVTDQGSFPFEVYVMADDGAIKSDLSVIPGDYKAGDKIRLRAKLTQFGSPILGLGSHPSDKIQVDLIKPGQSIGDILSDSTASAAPSGPDPQSAAKAKLFNALQANPSPLDRQSGTVHLFDDGKPEHGDDVAGDGIYSALYPAILPGHYNFLFSIERTDPNSARFSRQQLRTAYVRAVPDAGNTVFQASVQSRNTLVIVMTPRFKPGPGCLSGDPKCGRMGPGWANYFWFTAGGQTPFKAKDNLDGTYTATLPFTGARPPKVSVGFEDALAVIGDSVTFDKLPAKPTTLVDHIPGAPGKLAAFLDLGVGVPHGTFGSAFNTGFSLNAGLEYVASNHFSVEGIFGYHRFPAKIAGDLNVYQFSVNAKTYLATGSVRPFVNGGIGGYKFSPGPTNFGGNFGGGLLYVLTPHWGLQGSYNFHAVNTPVAATKFSTLQGGIRFVF